MKGDSFLYCSKGRFQIRHKVSEEEDNTRVTIGTTATSFKAEHAPIPASLGDAAGYWHRFERLEDAEIYNRGMESSYHYQQNSGTIYLYFPLDAEYTRFAIEATISKKRVQLAAPITFGGTLLYEIDSDASFWWLDHDESGQPFLIFELAKQDSFYNWPSIFALNSA